MNSLGAVFQISRRRREEGGNTRLQAESASLCLPMPPTIAYFKGRRKIVTELGGKVCWSTEPLHANLCSTGETLVGCSRLFSSSGFSEVSTIAPAFEPSSAPLSLISVS